MKKKKIQFEMELKLDVYEADDYGKIWDICKKILEIDNVYILKISAYYPDRLMKLKEINL